MAITENTLKKYMFAGVIKVPGITEKRLVLNDLVYNIFVLSDLTLIRNETLSIDSVYPNFIFTIQSQLICQSQN